MAATYTPVPRSMPSLQRSNLITAVVAGDQIDIVDVLGRPARGLQFVTTDSADQVDYRLNNLVRLIRPVEGLSGTSEPIWSQASSYPIYQSVGEVIETQSGLQVASVEIDALTLSTGTEIEIVVW